MGMSGSFTAARFGEVEERGASTSTGRPKQVEKVMG